MGQYEILLKDEALNDSGLSAFDLITALCAEHQAELQRITHISQVVQSDAYSSAIFYFDKAAQKRERRGYSTGTIDPRAFDLEPARKALDAVYWGKALALTDVMEAMPSKRRSEWYEAINGADCPEFSEQIVRDTLQSLVAERGRFFAERVDSVFQGLSREHVTNSPTGFRRRMILSWIFDENGWLKHSNAGVISDLRVVVAKLMKRGEPASRLTEEALTHARRYHCGEWHELDGGAIRFRCYKVGTVHLEVDEDIACELNSVLSLLYPSAIPARFRTPSKRKSKTQRQFYLHQRRLSFGVINLLSTLNPRSEQGVWTCWMQNTLSADKYSLSEARRVVEAIGGVRRNNISDYFEFDYNPASVLREVIDTGCIPEHKSHQFYPTRENLASYAASLLEAEVGDSCCEPSAGQGGLADYLPKETTTCVEVSALHCKILQAKGYTVHHADFLEWAKTAPKVRKVLMNPPFSQGRAQAHLEAAASIVESGGRLVAILPASMRGKDLLPGFSQEWHGPYENEFDGTGVSVVILVANRQS